MPIARRETTILVLGDVFLLVLSLWFALTARNLAVPSVGYFGEHLSGFVFVFAASLLIFYIAGLYERQTRLIKRILGTRVLGAQIGNTVLAALLFFVLPFAIAPKTVLALYLLISVILISTWRFFIVPLLSVAQLQPAIMIAEGAAVDEVLTMVRGNKKYYVNFVAHIQPSTIEPGMLESVLSEELKKGARLIVIDTRNPSIRAELPSLYDAMLEGTVFSEFSTFYESLCDRVPAAHIDHSWLLECLPRTNLSYSLAKRTIDILGALIGIFIAAPFVFVAILITYVTSGGNPFVTHVRIGRGNRPFRIIKLRSMLIDDHGDPELQKQNKVTKVGQILRKTRIDELPQLWNILVGDLSFIGPRPELPTIAKVYQEQIPYYEVRHLITPGLSGWAQIYDYDAPRGGADIERTRRKLSYDMYYLKHRSFGLDMAIGLKTVRALLSFSGT